MAKKDKDGFSVADFSKPATWQKIAKQTDRLTLSTPGPQGERLLSNGHLMAPCPAFVTSADTLRGMFPGAFVNEMDFASMMQCSAPFDPQDKSVLLRTRIEHYGGALYWDDAKKIGVLIATHYADLIGPTVVGDYDKRNRERECFHCPVAFGIDGRVVMPMDPRLTDHERNALRWMVEFVREVKK